MKLTTLIENSRADDKELFYEHGLSMFIECDGLKILFDTGKSGDFIENASKLGVNLNEIDYLVLSHAHYDHCGGVRRFFKDFKLKKDLIISKNFFKNPEKYHFSSGKIKADFSKEKGYSYVGVDFDLKFLEDNDISIKYAQKDILKLSENVFIFSNFKKYFDFENLNKNMVVKSSDEYKIDTFNEEISIGIKTKDGIIILLGCAHFGFLNIINTIKDRTCEKIAGVIGGTHLVEADETRILSSLNYLKKENIKILGLSHCTGEMATCILNKNLVSSFQNKTGSKLIIE